MEKRESEVPVIQGGRQTLANLGDFQSPPPTGPPSRPSNEALCSSPAASTVPFLVAQARQAGSADCLFRGTFLPKGARDPRTSGNAPSGFSAARFRVRSAGLPPASCPGEERGGGGVLKPRGRQPCRQREPPVPIFIPLPGNSTEREPPAQPPSALALLHHQPGDDPGHHGKGEEARTPPAAAAAAIGSWLSAPAAAAAAKESGALLKGRFLQQASPRPVSLKGRGYRRVGGKRAADRIPAKSTGCARPSLPGSRP